MPIITACLQIVREGVTALLFPAPCRICAQVLDEADRIPLCRACRLSLRELEGAFCERCGRPMLAPGVQAENRVLCHICRRGLYDFDFARSYGAYTREMALAIMLLKYDGVKPLGRWFAARLQESISTNQPECDIVVPVPVYSARLRERGYNHAELIAAPLARALGLPCRADVLIRSRPRPEKLRLTARERWRSVKGAYTASNRMRVDNLRILLVDDVLTTGATLDACSRALRKAGASKVVGLTVARAIPRWENLSTQSPPQGPNG